MKPILSLLIMILVILAAIGIYALATSHLNSPIQTAQAQNASASSWQPIVSCINKNLNTNMSVQFISDYAAFRCQFSAYGLQSDICSDIAACETILGERVTIG